MHEALSSSLFHGLCLGARERNCFSIQEDGSIAVSVQTKSFPEVSDLTVKLQQHYHRSLKLQGEDTSTSH